MTETKTKDALNAILKQYEDNNKPKNSSAKFNKKNYFSIYLEDGVEEAKKRVRILPAGKEDDTPFVELHVHTIEVDGKPRKFACLKEMFGEDCPFCEAREVLYATGEESDKELAKKYYPRRTYVCRVIDRDNENEGIKFWRFNQDYRKQGTFDKIIAIVSEKGDVTAEDGGRDLVIHVGRDQNNKCIIKSITDADPSPIHEDADLVAEWIGDERTWKDVYSVKDYQYLEIIVGGGTPVWDKENECFIDKASVKEEATDAENALDQEMAEEAEEAIGEETDATDVSDADLEQEEDDLPF